MKNMIRNIVRRAVISLAGLDDKDFPIQQIFYLGKSAECEIITPYGLHANLPANNEVWLTLFGVSGQEDTRLAMGYTPKLRPRNLPEGELVVYHPLTQSRMQYKNNGDIELDVTGENGDLILTIKKDLTISVGGNAIINVEGNATANVKGNVLLDVEGDITINADGTATINVPTTNWTGDINLTGNLNITGDHEVSGSSTLSATVTSNGKDISDTHIHPHGTPNTGPPV